MTLVVEKSGIFRAGREVRLTLRFASEDQAKEYLEAGLSNREFVFRMTEDVTIVREQATFTVNKQNPQ
jgi:hypothetical protein